MTPKTLKIIAIAVGAVVLLLIAGNVYSYISWTKAAERSRIAEIERAEALASAEEVARQAGEQIAAATRRADEALAEVGRAKQRERAALNQISNIVKERTDAMSKVSTDTDPTLALSTADLARATYPEETREIKILSTPTGFVMTRAATEAYKRSLIERTSLTEEISALREINLEKQNQIDQLLAVVRAGEDKYTALEARVASLENVKLFDEKRISALEAELKAEKRKNFWTTWKGRTIQIAAFAGGMVLGSAIK
jgi:hypothetical protein